MEQNSKKYFFLIIPFLVVSLVAAIMLTHLQAAEAPLTNQDVIKLSKLGLGEEVIISKINQSKDVSFNLDTDSLIKLKQEGVSSKVIEAMLNHGKSSVSKEPEVPAPAHKSGPIILSTKDGDFEPVPIRGTFSRTGFSGFHASFFNYPGLAARLRTIDKIPTLLVHQNADLRAAMFIVKLEKDEKNKLRSLKIGTQHAFSVDSAAMPDKDQIIPCEINEEKPGFWRIKFQGNLQPGEYGYYYQTNETHGVLYDFGID